MPDSIYERQSGLLLSRTAQPNRQSFCGFPSRGYLCVDGEHEHAVHDGTKLICTVSRHLATW